MITQCELKKQISATIGKLKVLELTKILEKDGFALHDLIDLTFDANKHIAFRAAWILENLFLKNPGRYEQDLEYLLHRIPDVEHESCQRHYAKILMHTTAPGALPLIISIVQSTNLEAVVEQCFDWIINPRVKIAVKLFSCDALFNLRHRYGIIKDELEDQIKFLMMSNPSPGIVSRGKKLLERLKAD